MQKPIKEKSKSLPDMAEDNYSTPTGESEDEGEDKGWTAKTNRALDFNNNLILTHARKHSVSAKMFNSMGVLITVINAIVMAFISTTLFITWDNCTSGNWQNLTCATFTVLAGVLQVVNHKYPMNTYSEQHRVAEHLWLNLSDIIRDQLALDYPKRHHAKGFMKYISKTIRKIRKVTMLPQCCSSGCCDRFNTTVYRYNRTLNRENTILLNTLKIFEPSNSTTNPQLGFKKYGEEKIEKKSKKREKISESTHETTPTLGMVDALGVTVETLGVSAAIVSPKVLSTKPLSAKQNSHVVILVSSDETDPSKEDS